MTFRGRESMIRIHWLSLLLGIIATGGGVMALQWLLLGKVVAQASYAFSTCVFSTTAFPDGDLENGRLLRRSLLPISLTRTFYNAQFQPVTQAEQPGRYGAVIRIRIAGHEALRFITLFRTAQVVHWDEFTLPISAPLPPELGVDPAVVQTQQRQIAEALQNAISDENGYSPPSIAILLAGLFETSPSDPAEVDRTGPLVRDTEWWYELRRRIGLTPTYRYLLDLPPGYDSTPKKRWPLILFLDHADNKGHLERTRTSGLAGLVHEGKQVPALIVSPECPEGEDWSTPVLVHLLDVLGARYRVDLDHVYLTGVSAGGDETWDFALAHPERLAAIVPMCGESDPTDAARLARLPIWAFHGEKDPVVPVAQTVRMIDAVRQAGGHPQLTLYPEESHDCWDKAYRTDALYTWLFQQKRNAGAGP